MKDLLVSVLVRERVQVNEGLASRYQSAIHPQERARYQIIEVPYTLTIQSVPDELDGTVVAQFCNRVLQKGGLPMDSGVIKFERLSLLAQRRGFELPTKGDKGDSDDN